MTGADLVKLTELQRTLRGSNLFAFERDGKYLLYRRLDSGFNIKIMARSAIDAFVRDALHALNKS